MGFQTTAIYSVGLAFTALAALLILAVVTGIPGRMKGLARGRRSPARVNPATAS